MSAPTALAQIRDAFWSDPLFATAFAAGVVALATAPIAFAVLGRMEWFQARRGRVLRRPSFAAVVVGMMLAMGIPAIFLALLAKSRHFDERRYEFDPNQELTVIDQGRMYRSRAEIQEAIRAEMRELARERKELVDNVKKLDEAMLTLRAAAGGAPAVAQALPRVLERLAGVRKSVGVDGPQQLMDFTAPPADLPAAPAGVAVAAAPAAVPAPAAPTPSAPTGAGLPPAQVQAELATVPDPQKPIAALLPLSGLPAGWVVGESGERHLETFNAENLFEKINGRAESFIQYDVRGMAYTYYHPEGDETTEVQLYIFDMSKPLNAFGKYGSEKPEDVTPIEVGAEGYQTAGSTFFYQGPLYVQLVSTSDDPKLAAFSLDLARRVASAAKSPQPAATPAPAAVAAATPSPSPAAPAPPPAPAPAEVGPEDLFKLLPGGPNRSGPKYVPQDAFGYSFLSNVFMADYEKDGVTWQGFLRPYADEAAAREVFEKYVDTARQDGAEIKEVEAEGAERMVVSSNIGLIDAVFLKGNAVAGANGAAEAAPAEAFARSFAEALPEKVPVIDTGSEGGGKSGEEN